MKGRLWAICPHCARWNLAPLEERWEALEQCERLFRATRIRTSTDQIGLAKLRDGTELVRIGEPLRPEFAAWRYSSTIALRRRRNLVLTGVGVLGATAIGAGVLAAGMGAGMVNILRMAVVAAKKRRDKRIVYRGPEAAGEGVTAGQLDQLLVQLPRPDREPGLLSLALPFEPKPNRVAGGAHFTRHTVFRGEGLLPVASLALARRNRLAGRPGDISSAVDLIDQHGNPFQEAGVTRQWLLRAGETIPAGGAPLKALPTPVRLGLEIAAHEEQERLFLASHLALLERAWREAEEIARIADDLLVPDWIRDRLGV